MQVVDSPFVSVVIPLYNKEQAIKSTLESLLGSTFQDFEIVVVDDGSTDRSVEIAQTVKDPRIRIISQANGGPSAARNTGVRESRGEWIFFFDADDLLYADGLETLVAGTGDPDVTVVNARIDIIDENGQLINRHNRRRNGKIPPEQNFRQFFFMRVFPGADTTLIRRDFMLQHPYREDLRRYEDAELNIRLCESAVFYAIGKSVAACRQEFSAASKVRPERFDVDFVKCLPFSSGCFWKNSYLGMILRSAEGSYVTRKKELRTRYKGFTHYKFLSYLLWKIGRLIYRE